MQLFSICAHINIHLHKCFILRRRRDGTHLFRRSTCYFAKYKINVCKSCTNYIYAVRVSIIILKLRFVVAAAHIFYIHTYLYIFWYWQHYYYADFSILCVYTAQTIQKPTPRSIRNDFAFELKMHSCRNKLIIIADFIQPHESICTHRVIIFILNMFSYITIFNR